MKAFEIRETCDSGNWIIGLTLEFHENCPDLICHNSYAILAARLLNLSYPEYLRYCASKGGTLKGRTGFPIVYFKQKKLAEEICQLINKEWDRFYQVYLSQSS